MFVWVEARKLALYFALSPVILGMIFFFLFKNPALVFVGVAGGFILPMVVLKQLQKIRRKKFASQLVDALISLSQSLRAGLSLLQALEVVVEDLQPPISQELALVVKEHKMGVPLETSFENLNQKMASDDLNMMTTAIMVARETGGNLTDIFNHLSENIRIKKRINDQIKTLTTQARWQGMIMSGLPVVFAVFITNINPTFFETMLETDLGRGLLVWCVVSEVIGAVLLNRLSKIEV
ncbi:type II secretion system F family protein [Candidatus Omnitrophota bacterium]